MKSYQFDLITKTEKIKTHENDRTFDFTEYREFTSHIIGTNRDWHVLNSHNSIKNVKRIINPNSPIMLSHYYDDYGEKIDYLIYIDFGKYDFNKKVITFIDLELDILITKDLKYMILDMDELLDSFEEKRISDRELRTILFYMEFLVNKFNNSGIIETLEELYGKEPIKWILD